MLDAPFVYGEGELSTDSGCRSVSFYSPSLTIHRIDPVDVRLHRARRLNWPATDCDKPCWRHGGTESCECEEGDPGTTTAPGGW